MPNVHVCVYVYHNRVWVTARHFFYFYLYTYICVHVWHIILHNVHMYVFLAHAVRSIVGGGGGGYFGVENIELPSLVSEQSPNAKLIGRWVYSVNFELSI